MWDGGGKKIFNKKFQLLKIQSVTERGRKMRNDSFGGTPGGGGGGGGGGKTGPLPAPALWGTAVAGRV